MNVQMVVGADTPRPSTTPLTSSVLVHATEGENNHFGLVNEAGMWQSFNCLDLLTPTQICPNPLTETKAFSTAEWIPGISGAVFGAVQCSLVGSDAADMTSEVERVFGLVEGKGVERMLLKNRFVARVADSDDPNPVEWDAPQDLTPSGKSVPLTVALALLEGHAAAVYAGQPTLHMARAAATVLEASGLVVWEGDKAFTKNGAKVAIGGGYDDPTMLASGKWDIYATGEVYYERAPRLKTHALPVLPGDGLSQTDSDDPNQFTDNTIGVLSERMFRVAVDCFVAKATGTVWS